MQQFADYLHKVNRAFDNVPPFWLIFFLLCANHLMPLMTENEEMYYGLARQYIDSTWIPHSFTFTESPGTRLLFQVLIGPFLTTIPFEVVSVIGQLICYAIYAFLLTKIFRLLEINNVLIFFLLQLLFMTLQAFIGGEWIFRNFETKSIAYIFVFLSIIEFLHTNFKKSVLWVVPAFYFHVLVGGWYLIALMLFFLIKGLPIKTSFFYGMLFLLFTSPWLIYLLNDILLSQQKVINGINLDWVYTYFRNPHHTVTFNMGWPWFRKHRAEGVGMILLAILLGSILFKKTDHLILKNIWLFCFSTYLMLLLAFGLSYFDDTGRFLKFYVYRIAGVSYLLTLIVILSHLERWLIQQSYKHIVYFIMLIMSTIYLPIKFNDNIKKQITITTDPYYEALGYLKANTSPGEIVACLHNSFKAYLPRETRLEPVVSYKFVPSGTEKLYEWYHRLKETEKVEKNLKLLPNYCSKYKVSFIISTKPIGELTPKFSNKHYYIYKGEGF